MKIQKNKAIFLYPIIFFTAVFSFAETWTFSALEVSSTQKDDISHTVLRGDVQVKSKNLEISAGYVELTGPDYELITGSDNILIKETEKNLTIESRRFDYDRDIKRIRFRGFVTLIDEDEGIVIRCESLDYYEDEEFVVMQSAVRLIQDDTIGRGEFATFRRKDNVLELSGRPTVWQEDDKYQADRIIVNLDTDAIILEGAVEGELITEDDAETADEKVKDAETADEKAKDAETTNE